MLYHNIKDLKGLGHDLDRNFIFYFLHVKWFTCTFLMIDQINRIFKYLILFLHTPISCNEPKCVNNLQEITTELKSNYAQRHQEM